MEPFSFFEQIYCINLDRRPERWQEVCKVFDSVGILHRVQRFPAIDHENPRRGCALSHLACIEQARRAGCLNVLIFEDDIRWRIWDPKLLEKAVTVLKKDNLWELFYLGGRLQRQATVISPEIVESRLWSTHAYAVSHRAYDRIAGFKLPIDVWYSRNFRSYCLRPMMAVQAKGFSDIKGSYIGKKEECFDESYRINTRYVNGQLSTNPLQRILARICVRMTRFKDILHSAISGKIPYNRLS